jgi:hypothetical protein
MQDAWPVFFHKRRLWPVQQAMGEGMRWEMAEFFVQRPKILDGRGIGLRAQDLGSGAHLVHASSPARGRERAAPQAKYFAVGALEAFIIRAWHLKLPPIFAKIIANRSAKRSRR